MANINVRIDPNVKRKAEQVFAKLGITPTSAISLFYNQVIRTNSIPFELKADMPNKETLSALDELGEMENNPDAHESFNSVDELMKDLVN